MVPHGSRKANDVFQADVPFPSLHAADVRSVQGTSVSKRFLRHPQFQTRLRRPLAKPYLWRTLHLGMMPRLTTICLQTLSSTCVRRVCRQLRTRLC